MAINLKGRSLLTLRDFTLPEIRYLLDIAHHVKSEKKAGVVGQRFAGKTLAMLFEKRSTRTRCAFQTAFGEEAGCAVFLSMEDIQLAEKEPIEDTARVLGRMFDAIQFRGYKQQTVERLAEYSGIPVYNGLTDTYHPTQALADLMTFEEEFDNLQGKNLVFVGDGRNNVANSLLIGSAKTGLNFTVVAPPELAPDAELLDYCKREAAISGAQIRVTPQMTQGLPGADAIYTDVWVSMGEENKTSERLKLLTPYQVTEAALQQSGKTSTIFLHCLPAVKGNEVVADVLEGNRSRVWDQAENRKHTIKALLIATL